MPLNETMFPFLSIEMPRPTQSPQVKDGMRVQFKSGPLALETIPGAAASVGLTIANWAEADVTLRQTMELLLPGDRIAAHKLVDSLRTDDHVAALLPLVTSVSIMRNDIPKIEQVLLTVTDPFLKRRSSLKRYRDQFAHGTWATRSDISDRIVLQKADFTRDDVLANEEMLWVKRSDKQVQSIEDPDLKATISEAAELLSHKNKKAELWSQGDFQAATNASSAYLNTTIALCAMLMAAQKPDAIELIDEAGMFRDDNP